MYIYLDESGDFGFDFKKKGTSAKFVLTLLCCEEQVAVKTIKNAIRRTIKNKVNRGGKKNTTVELKGTNTDISVKQYFYKQIKSDKWSIYCIVLNKQRVFDKFHKRSGQSKMYNFLSRFIVDKLPLASINTNVRMIVDKCKNRSEVKDFNNYLSNYVEGRLPLNTDFHIEHLGSHEDQLLQAVDLFCWGIARKYEHNDLKWYNLFRERIAFESEYLPGCGA